MTTYTFAQYRARCAQELGDFLAGTVTAFPSSGTQTTLQLQDTRQWPIVGSSDVFKDYFLLRPWAANASDRFRYVETHTPSGGSLVPDVAWAQAPLASPNTSAENYELSAILRPDYALNCLNQAMLRCLTETEFTLPAIVNVTRHSLATAAPWLGDKDFVRAVGYLTPSDLREQVDPYIYNPVVGQATKFDGVVYLDHPGRTFNGTETIYVKAIKPAYWQITNTATGTMSLTGFTFGNEDSIGDNLTCFIDPEWVASAFLVEAWRQYGHALDAASNQRLLRDRSEAAAWFSDLTAINLKVPPLEFKMVDNFGPRPSGWGPSH